MISAEKYPPEIQLKYANRYLQLTAEHSGTAVNVVTLFSRSWPLFAPDGRAVINSGEFERFYKVAMEEGHKDHPAFRSLSELATEAKEAAAQLCGADCDIDFTKVLFSALAPEVNIRYAQ